MIIKPKSRGFVCTTAHPAGCFKNVEDMVNAAEQIPAPEPERPRNVLVIGASGGYGLASRIVAAFACGARTVGVSLEKEGSEKRTATAGYYNNQAFDRLAARRSLSHATLNGDAFSDEMKARTMEACKTLFEGEPVDLLIYSLASPRRIHPATGKIHSSIIKPVGEAYTGKTVDFHTGVVSDITLEPASPREIEDTVCVMGGEDWQLWVEKLAAEDLLAEGFTTVAYSYIGSPITQAIYKDGTIGRAKDDLLRCCHALNQELKSCRGRAFVSVNKAIVTQASAAIPVVPLYISLLYRIMKGNGTHETCFDQIRRLFTEHLYAAGGPGADEEYRIRLDDLELRADNQDAVARLWPQITSDNIESLTDLAGYRDEFFSLFGFRRSDVDYEADVAEY